MKSKATDKPVKLTEKQKETLMYLKRVKFAWRYALDRRVVNTLLENGLIKKIGNSGDITVSDKGKKWKP